MSQDPPDAATLSQALIIWIGYGRAAWPQRDERQLAEHIGADAAAELLPHLRELHDEFYATDANRRAPDLVTMGQMATADFRPNHPEIFEAAVRALAWSYTYDYK